MFASFTAFVALAASFASVEALPAKRSQSASVTPHVQYSSSIGVLGCKINTNRVAYWPMGVDCDNICVKVSHEGRSLNLLKIDSSGGAFDISYDAWNYLGFGSSATESPQMGGGIPMEYEMVPASECADLLDNGKLPLSASNSMNYIASCLAQPNSWVAQNMEMLNINDPICKWGTDEKCSLDLAVSNQPSCPTQLGTPNQLHMPIMNIEYGTGNEVAA